VRPEALLSGCQQLRWNFEQLLGKRDEFLSWETAMPFTSASFVLCSTQGMALSTSMAGQDGFSSAERLQLLGDFVFGSVQTGKEDAPPVIEIVRDHRAVLKLKVKRGRDRFNHELPVRGACPPNRR
jgi:hypothetical protein